MTVIVITRQVEAMNDYARTDLPERIWDEQETADYIGINDRTLQRLEKAGQGPPRIQLSWRRKGYLPSDVRAWLLARRIPAQTA